MNTQSQQDIDETGDIPFVVDYRQQTKAGGIGIISMKLVSEGQVHSADVENSLFAQDFVSESLLNNWAIRTSGLGLAGRASATAVAAQRRSN